MQAKRLVGSSVDRCIILTISWSIIFQNEKLYFSTNSIPTHRIFSCKINYLCPSSWLTFTTEFIIKPCIIMLNSQSDAIKFCTHFSLSICLLIDIRHCYISNLLVPKKIEKLMCPMIDFCCFFPTHSQML